MLPPKALVLPARSLPGGAMTIDPLIVIEGAAHSAVAYRQWRDHFSERAPQVRTHLHWDAATRMAATFWSTQRRGKPVYWIAFAHTVVNFRKKLLVEVNPPHHGVNANFQGIFARSAKGKRYVLHRGELHPGRERILPENFLPRCTVPLARVTFSNGSFVQCAVVAPLDEGADRAVDATAQFVSDCARARSATVVADDTLEQRLFDLEHVSPELRGNFVIPAQDQRTGVRRHGDVWDALHKQLEKEGLAPANARLGLYGPDMYTRKGTPRVLFEIKSQRRQRFHSTGRRSALCLREAATGACGESSRAPIGPLRSVAIRVGAPRHPLDNVRRPSKPWLQPQTGTENADH